MSQSTQELTTEAKKEVSTAHLSLECGRNAAAAATTKSTSPPGAKMSSTLARTPSSQEAARKESNSPVGHFQGEASASA